MHVADDVPGDALVDGDVAVRLGTDEVRAPESPDDDAGGADCLRMVAGGQWRDIACTSSFGALCEKG